MELIIHFKLSLILLTNFNKIQIDLAENLNIKKITHKNQNLSFSRELDAVLINFRSTIKKDSIFVLIITVKILGQQIAFCNLC